MAYLSEAGTVGTSTQLRTEDRKTMPSQKSSVHPLLVQLASEFSTNDPAITEVALEALLKAGGSPIASALCWNPTLPDALTAKLISRKVPAGEAKVLCSRRLTPDLVTQLLNVERRDSVLGVALRAHRYDDDTLVPFVSASRAVADLLASGRDRDRSARVVAAPHSSLAARLLVAGDFPDSFSTSEIAQWLANETLWPEPRRAPRRELARLLWLRPELIATITPASNPALVMTAAGSPALRDDKARAAVVNAVVAQGERFALLALVANPFISMTELDAVAHGLPSYLVSEFQDARHKRRNQPNAQTDLKTVEDPSTLASLLRRAFPSDFRPHGRPLEILELSKNPGIERDHRIQALRASSYGHPELAAEFAVALAELGAASDESSTYYDPDQPGGHAYDPALVDQSSCGDVSVSRLPTSAALRKQFAAAAALACNQDAERWETLWGLVCTFEGTVSELLAVATML